MANRRMFRCLAAGMVVAVACAAGCENKVTAENFAKVKIGMTQSEVEGILGAGTDDTASAGYGASSAGVLESKASKEKTYIWKTPEGTVFQVIFAEGKVVQMSQQGS